MSREPEYLSGEWFRTRTDEQLRQIADGNIPGGKGYDEAMRELGRRGADKQHRQQMRWIKATFWVSAVLGLIAIGATLLA